MSHPEVERFIGVMERLRRECPWDAEQTHRTLVTYLVEETAETVEAVETGDDADLREELGDLLLQVIFHATIAAERGAFTLDDVASGLHRALPVAGSAEQAAEMVVADLLGHQARLGAGAVPPISTVRLRVTRRDLLPVDVTLPGPADLIVYPVHDGPDAATRLTWAQVDALGEALQAQGAAGDSDLERVGVAALPATMAEPVTVVRVPVLPGPPALRVGGDLYTGSRLLDLPALLGALGVPVATELLIGAPSARELWLVPAVPEAYAAPFDQRMAEVYRRSSTRIAPRAYLWREGRLRTR